ncbi:flagellar motor switch protein FliN [bacterium]|nr:flagellar motor switch protein FliN [bacterium]
MNEEIAVKLSELMMGKELAEVGKEALLNQAYIEIMTQVFGTSLPMLQNFFGGIVEGVVEKVFTTESENGLIECEDSIYITKFEVHIESVGTGKFIIVFPRSFIEENKNFFDTGESEEIDAVTLEEESLDEQIDINELEKVIGELEKKHGVEETPAKQESIEEQMPQQQEQQPQFQQPQQQPQQQQFQQESVQTQFAQHGKSYQQQFSNASIQPVEFSQIPGTTNEPMPKNIELLLDVPLDVTVELGRTRKKIREILDLGVGSVVDLDKLAGESVDLLVNDNLIAKGEVVVIDENFGIRITTIVSPQERLERLK